MWDEPYLETCCRSALHRMFLAGLAGRPRDAMDGPCITRLTAMGLCEACQGDNVALTEAGKQRHADEVLNNRRITTTGR